MKGLKGIASFRINTMSRSLTVAYDESVIARQDITRAISETGMEARTEKKQEAGAATVWWRGPRILILSACGIIILLAFMVEHIFGLSHKTAAFLFASATVIGGYYLPGWGFRPSGP